MRFAGLFIVAVVAFAACSSSSSTPTPTLTATALPKVYVMTTSTGEAWLRRVVAAYEQGDSKTAGSQCNEGRLQMAKSNLNNVVSNSNDEGGMLDYNTLTEICDSAERDGWPSIRESVLKAIGR